MGRAGLRQLFRLQSELAEQHRIHIVFRIVGCQQRVAGENGIRPCRENTRACVSSDISVRPAESRTWLCGIMMRARGDRAHEIQRVDRLRVRQRRALNRDQHVDRHASPAALEGWPVLPACRCGPAPLRPCPECRPEQIFMPASRTFASVSRRSAKDRVVMISP